MELFTLSIIGFVSLLGLWVWSYNYRPRNFPPGPWTPPVVGALPFLGKSPHETIAKLGKKYGSLFSFKIASIMVIIMNDWEAVKACFLDQGEQFYGRYPFVVVDHLTNKDDLAFIGGQNWKERKRFCLHHFKNLGFGKVKSEEYIIEETEALIQYIKEDGGQKVPVSYMFLVPLLNIIWRFIGGKRFDIRDKKIQAFSSSIINVFENGSATNLLLFMPFLRHFPGPMKRQFLNLKNSHHLITQFIEGEVDEHIRTYQEGHDRDFMDAFITEMRKSENSKEKFRKEVLVGIACDFFNAAVDAGSHSLAWALLYMATWQDIQHKVHEEIDRVVGRERLPTYPDRNRLRYTEAVVLEVLRFSSVAPLSVPHTAVVPTKVLGYDIPKDTFIVQNLWHVHFDTELWGDPGVFRPERFLDENGDIHRPEYLIPFGIGFRMCIGEPLGKMEMFLMFAGLMHQFAVSYVSGEERPSFKVCLGLNSRHEDFSLNFRVR